MKRFTKIFIVILYTIFVIVNLFSSPINLNTAKSVAEFQLQIKNVASAFTITDIIEMKASNGSTIAFIANLKPDGFIAISSDTNIIPIIAYSFKSNFYFDNDPNNILYHMLKKDLELRKKEITDGMAKDTPSNIKMWKHYINKDVSFFNSRNFQKWPATGNRNTDGLISTTWSQIDPYNQNCPLDPKTGKRSSVGSAAVALAQIINYHKHLGNASFNQTSSYTTINGINIDKDNQTADFPSFSNLNNKLKKVHQKYLNNSPLNNDDIATICFAAGISVNMHFTSSGAASWTWDIAHAFRNKFNFKKAKVSYLDSDQFFIDLQNNAKGKYPVNILVDDYYEHSFICDGYNTDNEYHLNFGWAQKSNGKYTLAWYKFPRSINSDYNIISQAIMFIGEGIEKISFAEISPEKIDLEDSLTTVIDLFTEEENKETPAEEDKSSVIEETIDAALEDENLPALGSTSKFVIYEIGPVPIKRIAPKYPSFIKKRGIQGQVLLNVEILATGDVGEVQVLKSLLAGEGGLDEAAVKAVKKWKFEPAKSSGKSVACWVTFPITFKIE